MSAESQAYEALLILVKAIQEDVHEMKDTLNTHIETEPGDWAARVQDLMERSFPQGDAEGHRRFHEASIKSAESRAEFWGKMLQELTKWGLIGFTFWALKTMVEAAAVWLQAFGHGK